MQVPPQENPIWNALVTGKKNAEITFLAARILLARLRLNVRNNPAAAAPGAAELWALYAKNAQLQSVQKDLAGLNL